MIFKKKSRKLITDDMSNMFSGCQALTLDINSWNVSNADDMTNMFNGCRDLTSLDLSGWDDMTTVTSTNDSIDDDY